MFGVSSWQPAPIAVDRGHDQSISGSILSSCRSHISAGITERKEAEGRGGGGDGGGKGEDRHDLICTRSDMTLETEMGIRGRFVLPGWPVEVVHPVDSSSPLWRISEDQLQNDNFEVIVTIDGTQESTGSSTRFVTSYLASEIRWGHQLTGLTFREASRSGPGWSIDCSPVRRFGSNSIIFPMQRRRVD